VGDVVVVTVTRVLQTVAGRMIFAVPDTRTDIVPGVTARSARDRGAVE